MVSAARYGDNPILSPNKASPWESQAVFNGSAVIHNGNYFLFYRAQGEKQQYANTQISKSSIGLANGQDGVHFSNRRQFITGEEPYERFGCEDPRVTRFEDKFYIFYTALSSFPFTPEGIKVAAAVTRDFQKIEEKHQVTTFNSKAFALFPERIGGKIVAVLTADTDRPPSKIAIAQFNRTDDIWSKMYWDDFYSTLAAHTLVLQRSDHDHVEVGAPPVKTAECWLLVYCYIYNYFIQHSTFAIEAVLLKDDDPKQVIARTRQPLLVPEKHYELYGLVPNVIFPSGALVDKDELVIYYGAADTSICQARVNLKVLLADMLPQ